MKEENDKKSFNKPLIVYRIQSTKVFEITKSIIKFLIEKNFVKYIYLESLDNINSKIIFGNDEKEKYFKIFDKNEDSNLCIIIGGDGTCLWAKSKYEGKDKPPFLSFHGGKLGFLSIYNTEDYEKIFTELYTTNHYSYIRRKEIICTLYEKEDTNDDDDISDFSNYKMIAAYDALNELTLEKKANMSHLYLFLENTILGKVACDGMIVSTPTGSTAYSLSAGGPILHSNVDGIIVTPICPFSLSFRPIVLPPDIKLRIKNDHNWLSIIKVDGQDKGILKNNQYLEISMKGTPIDFIVLKSTEDNLDNLWIKKLSNSLGWNFNFTH